MTAASAKSRMLITSNIHRQLLINVAECSCWLLLSLASPLMLMAISLYFLHIFSTGKTFQAKMLLEGGGLDKSITCFGSLFFYISRKKFCTNANKMCIIWPLGPVAASQPVTRALSWSKVNCCSLSAIECSCRALTNRKHPQHETYWNIYHTMKNTIQRQDNHCM